MYIATLAKSKSTGHDSCAPVGAAQSCSWITVNGSPILLKGYKMLPHGCKDHGPHQGIIAEGSSFVSVNGVPVAMDGSRISGCPGNTSLSGGDSLVNIES